MPRRSTTITEPVSPADSNTVYMILVGDNAEELDDAVWRYRILGTWVSPFKKKERIGTIVAAPKSVCEWVGPSMAHDFGFRIETLSDEKEAISRLNAIMQEGIDDSAD